MVLLRALIRTFTAFLLIAVIGCQAPPPKITATAPAQTNYRIDTDGVFVYPQQGEAKAIRIQVWNEGTLRITSSPTQQLPTINSLMARPASTKTPFDYAIDNHYMVVTTSKFKASTSLQTGVLLVQDKAGNILLQTLNSGQFDVVSEDPEPSAVENFAISQEFLSNDHERFFGLGQHQSDRVNLAKRNIELSSNTMNTAIPLLVSSNRYGLLWDNNGISRFGQCAPPKPLTEGFELFDTAGNPGGLSAYYYDGDELIFTRQERDTNYQHLKQGRQREFPLPLATQGVKNLRVELHGSIVAKTPGINTLKIYSSGDLKFYLDNRLAIDRWRASDNPGYQDIQAEFNARQRTSIKVYWTPENGYLRLLQYPAAEDDSVTRLCSETAKAIDFYIIAGNSTDEIIAGYRHLTGKAVLLPRWAYGFWQSRESYQTQEELLAVLNNYRTQKIPLDNIVLDGSYWPENAWGSHEFASSRFPDPAVMVKKAHEQNVQTMISVWPKFYPMTEHYRQFDKNGWLFKKNIQQQNLDGIGSGYLSAFYDAFNSDATQLFWQQIDRKLQVMDFDGWSLKATEANMHGNVSTTKRKELLSPNALGSGAEYFNAYALPHAEAVYQGDRKGSPDQRTVLLSSSGFAGIQRTPTVLRTGDTASQWSDLREQIAGGIALGLSGVPNWSSDIGGLTPENRLRYNAKGEKVTSWRDINPKQLAEWQELNLRWLQFAALTPVFRSHGQSPYRELFNLAKPGSDIYKALLWHTRLRYRLMPYIYTLAGDSYHRDSTLVRGLMMDFPDDPKVYDIADQYMFGPSLLVSPVTQFKARSREVYLPKGSDWLNFYSGQRHSGGQTIVAEAPLDHIPIFVRAGAIIPTGPQIQYVNELPDAPITINIFYGADGYFELYEDDGQSYAYETGDWSRIPIEFHNEKRQLRFGDRIGKLKGAPLKRQFKIRWIKGKRNDASDFRHPADAIVTYNGEELIIQL